MLKAMRSERVKVYLTHHWGGLEDKMNRTEKRRVVVIDDDEGTVEIIAAFLAEIPTIDARVFTAPRVLLAELRSMPAADFPSLIFSDIIMPDHNGLQLIDEVETICRGRGLAMPQVIFISGNVKESDRADDVLHCIRERGYQTLSKPFRMETILQVTQKAIA